MDDAASKQKEQIVGLFSRAAPTYDRIGPRSFAHFGQRLVDLAQIAPGAHVLDVATGRGAVLFPAAARVGPEGYAVGIDLAEPMVRATAAEISQRGMTNAEVRLMDAEQLHFPDAVFDWVLCGFALWFFPDLERALAEIRRVLRPGGRVAVSTWWEYNEPEKRFGDLLKAYRCDFRLGPHTLRTRAAVQAALQQARFDHIEVTPEEVDFVYADEDEWWGMMWSGGPRAALERMPLDTLKRFKSEAFEMVQAFKQPDGIHNRRRVLYTTAVVPG